MASNIGTAYVQIVPAATGISQKMNAAIAPGAASAGVTAGQKIAGSIGATMKKVGGGMMKAGAIATAVSVPIIAGIKKALGAYGIQNAAETKLTEIYKTRMGLTDKAAKSTMAYAAALQKEGVVGDEVMLSGAQQLATFASTNKTVESLLPAMNNLMVQQKGLNGTQQDATQIANLMGKVLQGQTGALKRVGISFTEEQEAILKTGNEEERAAMLAQVITDNVGDMNKAMLNTPEGRMKQLSNTLGDMQEEIGRALVPVLADIATYVQKKIMPVVSKVIKIIQGNKTIAKIIIGVTALLAVGGPLLMIIGALVSSVGALLPVLGAISAPVLAIVGIIAAVVTAIGIAYAKNEQFRKAINDMVKQVSAAFKQLLAAVMPVVKSIIAILIKLVLEIAKSLTPVIQKMTPIILAVVNSITAAIKKASPIILAILKTLAKVVATVVGTVAKHFANLLSKVLPIWNKITAVIKTAVSNIKKYLNFTAIVNGVRNTFNRVKDFISKPIEKAKDLVKKAIDFIKGIFPIKLGKIFSGIKLPHFKISGGKIPWGIGGAGKKPTVGIDWYAKGGVFNSPQVVGVAESGREAAIPLEGRYMRPFAEAIASEMSGAGNVYNIGDINLNAKDLQDIVTLEQLVAVIKRAKAMA